MAFDFPSSPTNGQTYSSGGVDFVFNGVAWITTASDEGYAPLASPAFTGTPTAPTAALGTSTVQLATTSFVAQAISGVTGGTIGEAPNNGELYGRKNLGWTLIPGGSSVPEAPTDGGIYGRKGSTASWQLLDIVVNWGDIVGVPAAFTPAAHNHPIGEVTNLQAALDSKAPTIHTHAYSSLTGIPSTFTPATHNHAQADITNLITDLGSKQGLDPTLTALAGLDTTPGLIEQTGTDVFAKRALGVAAATAVPTRADADARYAPVVHTHVVANITDFPRIDGPAFSVHRNGTNQTGLGAVTKIVWTTEEYDTGGYFASNRFTPQVAGIYQINASALVALVEDTTTVQIEIRKNGSPHRYGSAVPGGYAGNPQSIVSALVSFNGTTDWIEFWVNQDDTVVRDLYGAANTTYAQGVWIRPLP